jgi:uncharacterized protein (DUF1800 family)
VTQLSTQAQISRLIHRFGFGPKPGQFAQLMAGGLESAQTAIFTVPAVDPGLVDLKTPTFAKIGSLVSKAAKLQDALQYYQLVFWWLDRMVLSDNALPERMTWFWHGHWATAISKVNYSTPMLTQNQVFRQNALGSFDTMSQSMINDAALQYWLDGQKNLIAAPNENLSREFMELFTLGVDNYSQADVTGLAKSFTGYRLSASSLEAGVITFTPKFHDTSTVTILGNTGAFTPQDATALLTKQKSCQDFIAQRLWFRFYSSSVPQPDTTLSDAFATRDIGAAVKALVYHPALSSPLHAQAKSPVEWFVSSCRALNIHPSKLPTQSTVFSALARMGNTPFNPPNVGGWPPDEFWLGAAQAQERINLSKYLVSNGDLSPIASLPAKQRVAAAAMWLGVAGWGATTQQVLTSAASDPARLAWLALNAPEYVVNQ